MVAFLFGLRLLSSAHSSSHILEAILDFSHSAGPKVHFFAVAIAASASPSLRSTRPFGLTFRSHRHTPFDAAAISALRIPIVLRRCLFRLCLSGWRPEHSRFNVSSATRYPRRGRTNRPCQRGRGDPRTKLERYTLCSIRLRLSAMPR